MTLNEEMKIHYSDVNKSDIKINKQELTRAVKTMNEEEYAAYAVLEPNPSITIK